MIAHRRNFERCLIQVLLLIFAVSSLFPYPLKPELEETVVPRPGGELRVRAPGQRLNTDLDPAGEGYPLVIENLYEGLVRLDQNFNLLPGLANYWSVSENGKKVIFYLRPNAQFHNGQEVTAEDVKFSLERLFQLKTQPIFYELASRIEGGEEYWKGAAQEVSGLRVVEKKVLEINWKRPGVSNFYFLAAGFSRVLPASLMRSQKKRFFEKPVGAGPFKFDYWLRNRRLEVIGIRLVRNENYFDRKPLLEAVEISPYFTLEDFFQDEIQVIPYLTYKISREKYQILEGHLMQLSYLFFSCHIPPFDRPLVRRAIQSFIEKRQLAGLASTTSNFCQVMNCFIPPFLPGFLPESERAEENFSQVLQALEEAGLGRSDKPLVVNLYLEVGNRDLIYNIYQFLRDELKPAGIQLELKKNYSAEDLSREKTPYLFYLDWWPALPDPEFILWPLFHSEGSVNRERFHYRNARVDQLLEAQRNGINFERRVSLFKEIEKILENDLPAIPLFYHKQRLAFQPYLRSLKTLPFGYFCLNLREVWMVR